jgi:hypothetical protein
MLFTSPAGDTVVGFNMVGFVDDSTCIIGGNPDDTLQELLEKMKDDAQLHDFLWCWLVPARTDIFITCRGGAR